MKNGEKPGSPRFKGRNQYASFTYPDHAGWRFTRGHAGEGKALLALSTIGAVKVKMHREMEGKIKTLTVKREGEYWYCIFTCEVEVVPLAVLYEDVGIDLGVTHFAAFSNGAFIDHPRHFRQAEKKLAKAQQALSRKKKGSHRRAKAGKILAKQHRKVRNQRKDFDESGPGTAAGARAFAAVGRALGRAVEGTGSHRERTDRSRKEW